MLNRIARKLNKERQEHETVGQFHKRLAYTEAKIKEAIATFILFLAIAVTTLVIIFASTEEGYYVEKANNDGTGIHYEYKEGGLS